MNLDRFCILFCLLLLPLLWLPLDCFSMVISISAAFLLLTIFCKKLSWGILFLIILVSFYQVQKIAKNAQNITAYQTNAKVKITQILHDTDYQTAIGQLGNGLKLYLKWQTKEPLKLEKSYQANLKIRPISSRLNKGNFNKQQWYFANHIKGIATVKQASVLEKTTEQSIRTQWLNNVKSQTKNLATQGLILALGFGERAWLDNQHWHVFKQTATAHLIAISGLHIGLVAWLSFWLIKLLQYGILLFSTQISGQILSEICKKWGLSYRLPLLFGLSCAIGYAFLANFSMPTLRALLAISMVLACQLARRHYTPMQLWWRIIALLLICDPITLLSSSFWLSILAVLCLIIWYRYFPLKQIIALLPLKNTGQSNKIMHFIVALVHLQIGILLLFAPVQFYFFEGISPYSFVANLSIVPFYSLIIVPMILFSLITNNMLETWQITDYLLQISLEILTPLSHNWMTLSQYQQWQILTLNFAVLMLLYAWLNQKIKVWWRYITFITFLFNGAFYGYFFTLPKAQWITFDVGQGLANALVYRKGLQTRAILYDTGGSWGKGKAQNSMAKLEILPYLKRNDIEVEAIFLSHDDRDHSGGVTDILKAYPKARLISSSQQKYADRQPEICIEGKQWQFGDFHLQSYYPKPSQAGVFRSKNANSCVILVKIYDFRLLLTGDITQKQEPYFAPKIGKIDFLQVPHHGSKTSTSYTLLNYTQPKFVMISTGRWNMWHLPNKNVIKRLKERNIQVLDTAKVGMIAVDFDNNGYEIKITKGKERAWYNQLF
ncbi:ComEC family competence protein [Phocoenobacter uteri]|uniref:ComEC family competence protein n=1 Tax=Phocoenobacter uteri TaxID=146806 RepID=A0A379C8P6_9PAST|nr:DNA internalization-related competence protein ComEC/Rec2 [Phocoenobacter uteri]MDG6882473.1 recombinase [Phocoenobacter uteri]SUB58634.1 ComEC family competence protein [Phocoenobacter uteri]